MVKIAISGVCGQMGRMLVSCIANRTDCEVCCGIDLRTETDYKFPVYDSIRKMQEKPDVIIDYSHPSCLNGLLEYAKSTGTPIVLSTTGYSEEQLQQIRDAAKQAPLFSLSTAGREKKRFSAGHKSRSMRSGWDRPMPSTSPAR